MVMNICAGMAAALLAIGASTTAAGAMRLCKDVAARGKPNCSAGMAAVCTAPVHCLTSQFPAVGYRLCEAWACKTVADPPKDEPPKQL